MSPKLQATLPLILPPNPCAPSSSTFKPYLSATSRTAAKSAGSPNKSTATTALGCNLPSAMTFSIAASKDSTEILKVSRSTSTNTGVAPAWDTISPEEKNVKSGTNTASPSLIPQAIIAIVSASVPLAQVTQCFTPTYSASSFSKSFTCCPLIKLQFVATSTMAASMSFFNTWYCCFKSLNCI